jgi:hypothetical protein
VAWISISPVIGARDRWRRYRRAAMAVWLSRHSEQSFKLGISGNTRARVRRQKHGRIEINGRIQLGDYRTSHGYVSRGLPATIEVRSGTLRVNGRVTAGDGVRLQVQGGTLTIGDRTFFDGDSRIVCTTAVTRRGRRQGRASARSRCGQSRGHRPRGGAARSLAEGVAAAGQRVRRSPHLTCAVVPDRIVRETGPEETICR